MQSEKTDDTLEKIVIPLFEIIVYPDSRTKFQVDRGTGDLLLAGIEDPEAAYAVGLTVKSGTRPSEVTSESLYTTGNLFRISHVQPAEDGYLICVQVVQRVKVVSLSEKDGQFYAVYEPVPDVQDLEEDLKARILADIKSTIHDISSRFQGSEQFTQPIDRMESVDKIMGFVMPFLPVNLAEKQALLEIVSVRQRYIRSEEHTLNSSHT